MLSNSKLYNFSHKLLINYKQITDSESLLKDAEIPIPDISGRRCATSEVYPPIMTSAFLMITLEIGCPARPIVEPHPINVSLAKKWDVRYDRI